VPGFDDTRLPAMSEKGEIFQNFVPKIKELGLERMPVRVHPDSNPMNRQAGSIFSCVRVYGGTHRKYHDEDGRRNQQHDQNYINTASVSTESSLKEQEYPLGVPVAVAPVGALVVGLGLGVGVGGRQADAMSPTTTADVSSITFESGQS
jgi:hypothetical protein